MARRRSLDSDREPWERQTNETDHLYKLFLAYRDMPPPRPGLPDVAAELGLSRRYVSSLSSANLWIERAEAWDTRDEREPGRPYTRRRRSDALQLDPDLDPWERQPDEPKRAYDQFATYRDMKRPRPHLTEVAEQLGLSYDYVRQLASLGLWTERVEAWDNWLDEQYRIQWAEDRRQAAKHDAALLGSFKAKLISRLNSLRAEEMTPADTFRLLDIVLRHSRQLYGDPTETIALTGPGGGPIEISEFAALPPEARRDRLLELAEIARRRATAHLHDEDE